MNVVNFTLLLAALSAPAASQVIGQQKDRELAPITLKTVAIMPLVFRETDKGEEGECTNRTATNSYDTALREVFTKVGWKAYDDGVVVNAWRNVSGGLYSPSQGMPDPEKLVQLGKELKADYVVFSRCHYRITSIWQGLGPKTRASATVDLWIVDVMNSEFALKADEVKAGSTEKEPAWKTGVTLFVAPISVVSGGPKTPHMERAGHLAQTKALEPWLVKQAGGKIGG